jgi:hypothetical protein
MPTRIPINWDSVKAVEKWLAAYPNIDEYGGELLSAMRDAPLRRSDLRNLIEAAYTCPYPGHQAALTGTLGPPG